MNIYPKIWIYINLLVKLFIKKTGFYPLDTTIGSFIAIIFHRQLF